MAELKVKLDPRQMEEIIARIITHFAIDNGNLTRIVRCKECKWRNEPGCALRIVDDSDKPKDYDFCSFGERKEE